MNNARRSSDLWGSKQLLRLAQQIPPRKLIALLMLTVLGSLAESFGILLLVPLVALISGSTSAPAYIDQSMAAIILSSPALLLTGFAALMVARALLQQRQQIELTALQRKLIADLRLSAMHSIVHAQWRWLSTQRMSESSAVLLSDLTRLGWGIGHLLTLLSSAISIIIYLAVSIALSWLATVLALVVGAAAYSAATRYRQRIMVVGEAIGSSNAALHQQIEETLAGIKLVKSLGSEKARIKALGEVLATMEAQQQQAESDARKARTLIDAASAIFLAVLVYGALTWLHIPAERLLPLIIVFARFMPLLAGAQQGILSWLSALPALRRITELIEEAAAQAEPNATCARARVTKAITTDAASFTYIGSDRPAVANVSLTLPAQRTTAITGPSGAGKSTLADLLSGLIEPDTGRLLIDGRAIEGAELGEWRRSVAYVHQDAYFFDSSIADNLRLAKPGASDGEIRDVLSRVAADFIDKRAEALATRMGHGGKRFSGGERQRLALARALLASPELLVLDEATSALDPETEAVVVAAIEALRGAVTVVVISHRPIPGLTVDHHIAFDVEGKGEPSA
jgi:ATP-binding cassette, subfamily C, bacterial